MISANHVECWQFANSKWKVDCNAISGQSLDTNLEWKKLEFSADSDHWTFPFTLTGPLSIYYVVFSKSNQSDW